MTVENKVQKQPLTNEVIEKAVDLYKSSYPNFDEEKLNKAVEELKLGHEMVMANDSGFVKYMLEKMVESY